ncbi:MAG: hypothetical protein WCQ64_03280, partial [Acidobacteriota bacterium]
MKTLTVITGAFVFAAAVSVSAHQAPSVAGTWKLNVAESNNPNGPAPAPAGERRGGGVRLAGRRDGSRQTVDHRRRDVVGPALVLRDQRSRGAHEGPTLPVVGLVSWPWN